MINSDLTFQDPNLYLWVRHASKKERNQRREKMSLYNISQPTDSNLPNKAFLNVLFVRLELECWQWNQLISFDWMKSLHYPFSKAVKNYSKQENNFQSNKDVLSVSLFAYTPRLLLYIYVLLSNLSYIPLVKIEFYNLF